MYAITEPHAGGMLDVGNGHRIWWEEHGDPSGKPVVVLHGGPGAAPWTGAVRWFDPSRYRVVAFHQAARRKPLPSQSDPP